MFSPLFVCLSISRRILFGKVCDGTRTNPLVVGADPDLEYIVAEYALYRVPYRIVGLVISM